MRKVAVLGDSLAGGKIYGIQRFAYELLRELDRMDLQGLEVELVIPEHVRADREILDFKQIRIVRSGKIRNSFLWRQICFPLYAKSRGALSVDLTLGLPLSGSDISGLYDCTYEDFPDDFRTWKEKLRRLSYLVKAAAAAKSCRKLVVISRTAGRDLMKHYHLPASKLCLIPCAWQHYPKLPEDDSILTELGLMDEDGESVREYYFTLGSVLPHKNLKWIARAAEQNPDCLFVLTGSLDLSSWISSSGLKELKNVLVTGYLPDARVKSLMRHASAYIHPSLSEGFGIPPMEAMSLGTELLLSSASCLPEIYGDAALYFDPENYDSIRIKELLAREHADPSKVLKKYSWKKSALRLKKLLTEQAERGTCTKSAR